MRGRADIPKANPYDGDLELPNDAQVAAATSAFAMLADPTRLRLLWLLHSGEHDVGSLAQLTGTSPAATSQHLGKLRLGGLVVVRVEGRRRVYSARNAHVRQLIREALYHADHHVSGQPDHA